MNRDCAVLPAFMSRANAVSVMGDDSNMYKRIAVSAIYAGYIAPAGINFGCDGANGGRVGVVLKIVPAGIVSCSCAFAMGNVGTNSNAVPTVDNSRGLLSSIRVIAKGLVTLRITTVYGNNYRDACASDFNAGTVVRPSKYSAS